MPRPRGRTDLLPETRAAISRFARHHSVTETARAFDVCRNTVFTCVAESAPTAAGDHREVIRHRRHGGRKRKISAEMSDEMVNLLKDDPFAADGTLAVRLNDKCELTDDDALTANNVLRERKRRKIIIKCPTMVPGDLFTEAHRREHVAFLARVSAIAFNLRLYYDQHVKHLTLLGRRRMVKATRGESVPIAGQLKGRGRSRGAKNKGRAVLHAVLGYRGVVASFWTEENYTQEEIIKFLKEKVAPHLMRGQHFFLDRWGAQNKKDGTPRDGGHNHPEIRQLLADRGVTHQLLPRKGCLVDPIEVMFGDFDRYCEDTHRACEERGEIVTLDHVKSWWRDYLDQKPKGEGRTMTGLTREKVRGFFKLRADGEQLHKLKLPGF